MSKMLRVDVDTHKKLQFIAMIEDKKLIEVVKYLIDNKIKKDNLDINQLNLKG